MEDNKKIALNLENISVYVIDDSDSTKELSPVEQEELEKYNDDWVLTNVSKQLIETAVKAGCCSCRMDEVMLRTMRRNQIIGQDAPPEFLQDDLDSYTFGLVIYAKDGKYVSVSSVIMQCKKCGRINIWGDGEVMTKIIAEATTNHINNKQHEVEADVQEYDPDPAVANDAETEDPKNMDITDLHLVDKFGAVEPSDSTDEDD